MREETMINPSRRARFGILVVAAGLLAVGACSSDSGSTASAPPAPPLATGQPETVIGETYAQTEAPPSPYRLGSAIRQKFVVECNGNLGFEEPLLLLSGRHTLKLYQNSLTLSSYET
jgi:hypothetical protein